MSDDYNLFLSIKNMLNQEFGSRWMSTERKQSALLRNATYMVFP